MTIAEQLAAYLTDQGAVLVGFSDVSDLVSDGLGSAVSFAVYLGDEIVDSLPTGPIPAYLEAYHRINAQLDRMAEGGAELLRALGYRAQGITTAFVGPTDPDQNRTALPHKTVATRAGLGWIGKNALLVTREYGSAVRISVIRTDAPLPFGVPIIQSSCPPGCTICRAACVGGAIRGAQWEAGMPREALFDMPACRDGASDLCERLTGERRTICGRCIGVCPFTKAARAGRAAH